MTDMQGNTILHFAAKTSNAETITNLVKYGLDKDIRNVAGETPYIIAKRWHRPDTVLTALQNIDSKIITISDDSDDSK